MTGDSAAEERQENGIAVAVLLVLLVLCASRSSGASGSCGCRGCCQQQMSVSPAAIAYLKQQCQTIDPNALNEAANTVNSLVTSSLTQDQFDALVVYCYSIGPCDFAASDVLAEVNACNWDSAAQQLLFAGCRPSACLFAQCQAA